MNRGPFVEIEGEPKPGQDHLRPFRIRIYLVDVFALLLLLMLLGRML